MSFDNPHKTVENNTAVCISYPEKMTPEQKQVFAQKMIKAAREAGYEGSSVQWCETYDDYWGTPVFYIP